MWQVPSAFVLLVVFYLEGCNAQSVVCDAATDKCPFQANGECDSQLDECLGGDCFDCDPCQLLRYNCARCVANGCYYCPGDSSCLRTTQYQFNKISSCTVPSDYTRTCRNDDENFFSDPLYTAQRWVYDMINVLPVWQQGIIGSGVRVRINDVGVDSSHPEFEGRFDVAASCDGVFLPASSELNHGTIVASIIAGGANNGRCAVGIAPNTTISACYGLDKTTFLDEKLDMFDISHNSYNIYACSLGGGGSRALRKLQQKQATSCPFTFVDPSEVSPCQVCDFSNIASTSNVACQSAVITHCTSHYENDPVGCLEFLDILIPAGQCVYTSLSSDQLGRMANAILWGRDGKGTIFVYSSGNEFASGEDVNFQGYLNTRLTIPVGGVGKDGLHASYSTPGTALMVTGPGGDSENLSNIVAADLGGSGSCTATAYGTSFSAAVVSGVIALMLEVNPDLGWRDVQWILASTSKMVENDPDDDTKFTNAAGFTHSNFYGFGIVDAEAAVTVSQTWENKRPEFMAVRESGELNLIIPDDPSSSVTSTLSIDLGDVEFITESVVVYLDVQHASRGDLDIVLTSPQGTKSVLHPGNRPERSQLGQNEEWKLLTVRNWGESALGEWTLSITDISKGYVSTCIDRPWILYSYDVNLRCIEVEVNGICIDGQLNQLFFNGDKETLTEFTQATSDNGYTVLDACCVCGGGVSTTNGWVDQLVNWRIVVYGQHIKNSLPPSLSPSPTESPMQSGAGSSIPDSLTMRTLATLLFISFLNANNLMM